MKLFDCFDFLMNWEVTHMSNLNKGQWYTEKDDMVLGHMATIPFPVLCKCLNVVKITKTTKITSSINQRIKGIKHFWLFWFFKLLHRSIYNHKCQSVCWSVEKNSKLNNQKIKELWIFWLFDYWRYLRPTVTGVIKETQNQKVKRIIDFLNLWLIMSYFTKGIERLTKITGCQVTWQ